MSNLYAFLHPEIPQEKEVVISQRFKDENGKVVPFKIRPISGKENEVLIKQCTTPKTKKAPKQFDSQKYNRALVIAATVEPDFKNAELCAAYGVVDPEDLVTTMLLVGEYQKLSEEVLLLSGLDEDSAEEVEEEAKN